MPKDGEIAREGDRWRKVACEASGREQRPGEGDDRPKIASELVGADDVEGGSGEERLKRWVETVFFDPVFSDAVNRNAAEVAAEIDIVDRNARGDRQVAAERQRRDEAAREVDCAGARRRNRGDRVAAGPEAGAAPPSQITEKASPAEGAVVSALTVRTGLAALLLAETVARWPRKAGVAVAPSKRMTAPTN